MTDLLLKNLVSLLGFEPRPYGPKPQMQPGNTLERYIGSRGRDRTYDQLVNSQLHYRCATLELFGGSGRIRTYNVSYVADLQSVAFNQFSAHFQFVHTLRLCCQGPEWTSLRRVCIKVLSTTTLPVLPIKGSR